jgi:putative transcriptional regulator
MTVQMLKQARQEQGLTQEDISHLAGITLRTYQLIETGKTEPKICKALAICKILDISPFKVWNK